MNSSDTQSAESSDLVDWRERLHSLPGGAEPSQNIDLLLKVAFCLGLSIAGAAFVLVSGGIVGFSIFKIGPEQSGGALYYVLGAVMNIFAGAAISALVSGCLSSRSAARLVFYSFTAPACLMVAFLVLASAASLFR